MYRRGPELVQLGLGKQYDGRDVLHQLVRQREVDRLAYRVGGLALADCLVEARAALDKYLSPRPSRARLSGR